MQSSLNSALAQANLGFSEQIQQTAAQAIGLLLRAAISACSGAPNTFSDSSQIPSLLRSVIARQPPGPIVPPWRKHRPCDLRRPESRPFKDVLDDDQPANRGQQHAPARPPYTAEHFCRSGGGQCFSDVHLRAARRRGVALEREEHALAAPLRGLVSREQLLAEKALLAAACSFVLAFAMLAGIGAFVQLDWSRVGLWLAALAARCARVWSAGRGNRCACTRGPRRLAARLFAVAAAGLPGARAGQDQWPAASTTRSARSRSCFPSRPRCRR